MSGSECSHACPAQRGHGQESPHPTVLALSKPWTHPVSNGVTHLSRPALGSCFCLQNFKQCIAMCGLIHIEELQGVAAHDAHACRISGLVRHCASQISELELLGLPEGHLHQKTQSNKDTTMGPRIPGWDMLGKRRI